MVLRVLTLIAALATLSMMPAADAAPVFEIEPPRLPSSWEANVTTVSRSPYWSFTDSYIWTDMESGSTRTDSPSAIGALGSSILSEGHIYYVSNDVCYTNVRPISVAFGAIDSAEYVGTRFLRDAMVDVWRVQNTEPFQDYEFNYYFKAGTNLLYRVSYKGLQNGSQGYADFSNHVVGKLPAGTFEPPASCRNAHTRQQMNHMAMIVPSVGMLTAAWWLL